MTGGISGTASAIKPDHPEGNHLRITAILHDKPLKLEYVEVMRGVAAIAVVLFHMNAVASHGSLPWHPSLAVLSHGVDMFFVLSGFIIFYVHRNDIGRPVAAWPYVLKRAIRLMPLIWLVAGSWILIQIATGRPISPESIGTSLLLYPSLAKPDPVVLWTLRHEVLFYVAFLFLILSRKWGTILFSLWTILVIVQIVLSVNGNPVMGIAAFFFSSYELDFLFGAAVAYWFHRPSLGAIPFWMGLILVAVLLTIERFQGIDRTDLLDYTSLAATIWTPILGSAFALLLYGVLQLGNSRKIPSFILMAGAASYAIYLVHVPIQTIIRPIAEHLPGPIGLGVLALLPVLGGILVHVWLERPLSNRLREFLLPRRGEQAAEIADSVSEPGMRIATVAD